MAIIDSYNRKRGVTYVYESISYWDKELKQPRSKRRLLGRRDSETGELIPTRKQKRATDVTPVNSDSATDYAKLYKHSQQTIRAKDELIRQLRRELAVTRSLLQRQGKLIANAVAVLQSLEPEMEVPHV